MNNSPRTLSKSRFTLAMECPTKLFYTGKTNEYANTKGENEFLMALAEGGFQVGELAKLYYPNGHDIKDLDYFKSIEETNQLLQKNTVTIFEAAIAYENLFIRVDILEKVGNKINLIEVKAKSFNSESPEFLNKSGFIDSKWRPYLNDVAFQTYVVENAFPEWNVTPYLMLADKSKRATVNNLNQLFRIQISGKDKKRTECKVIEGISKTDLGDEILTKVPVRDFVEKIWAGTDIDETKKTKEQKKPFFERIKEYAQYYEKDENFPVSIGGHCKDCEFRNNQSNLKSGYEECWQSKVGDNFDVKEPHIFDIWNFRQSKKLIERKIYYIKDVDIESQFMNKTKVGDLEYKSNTSKRQALQIEKVQQNDWTEDIKPKLFEKMDDWTFPLHFIDFETSMVAIPFYKGRRPYEQTAFQFSCHTLYENGQIKHSEWINTKQGEFPNFEFVKELKKVLENDNGTIFRFAAHENTVLRQIKTQMEIDDVIHYKDLIEFINLITENKDENHKGDRSMMDLNKMVQQYYYHPLMGGSNSLKKVLPTIMSVSQFLKNKYSNSLQYGTRLKNEILWQEKNGKVADPYSLLPPIFDDIDHSRDEYIDSKGKIRDGGAAMTAYMLMQFSDMDSQTREKIINGLLKYCELDTLAMVMLWEHWQSLK